MLAFLLALAVFLYFFVVGLGLLAFLETRRNTVRSVLLAPIAGSAIIVLGVFWLNRLADLPARRFAWPLAGGLLILALAGIWKYRPVIPKRWTLRLAAVLLAGLVVNGRPLFEFGFDWVSYGNDDMANYALAADKFVDYGFYEPHGGDLALFRRDIPAMWSWYFHTVDGQRVGNELILAEVAALTGFSSVKIYMPVILGLYLVLASAAAALVVSAPYQRLAGLITAGLVTFSASTVLGVMYQLTSQVWGLAILAGGACVILRPIEDSWKLVAKRLVLGAVFLGAHCVIYPETLPFLGIALLIFVVRAVKRSAVQTWKLLVAFVGIGAFTFGMLLSYLAAVVNMIISQVVSTAVGGTLYFFPYLVPSGMANLWGIYPLNTLIPEPILSGGILLGMILVAFAIAAAFWTAFKGHVIGIIASVMWVLAHMLFFKGSDFGLWKMAMFIQPFMLGAMVLAWRDWSTTKSERRLAWREPTRRNVAPFVMLVLIGSYGLYYYVHGSRGLHGTTGSTFTEIPYASATGLMRELERLNRDTRQVIVSDTHNPVLAKLEAISMRGKNMFFPALREMPSVAPASPLIPGWFPVKYVSDDLNARSLAILKEIATTRQGVQFPIEPNGPDTTNPFLVDLRWNAIPLNAQTLLGVNANQTVINRRRVGRSATANLFALPMESVANHLLFVDSKLGMTYYLAQLGRVSLYQVEPDVMFSEHTMSGCGRYLMFRLLNPSPSVRLMVSMTSTLKADRENRLPQATVNGGTTVPLGLVGRGSGRVVSPPLTPRMVGGAPYLQVDMREQGTFFPFKRTGLMRLYGVNIKTDIRPLVGFMRDISLISEEEYQGIVAPTAVNQFPRDLMNPDFEYSGVYEDGWISEVSWMVLGQPETAGRLLIRGMVPEILDANFRTEIVVLMDGVEVARRMLKPGEFTLNTEVPMASGRRRVELRFSRTQRLPAPDGRPTAALMQFVGFVQGRANPVQTSQVTQPLD